MVTAPPEALHEVAPGVLAYVQQPGGWCLNNAGVLVGDDAVAVVDTAATEVRARALRRAVAAVTPKPPRYVVNTHHHGDHTFGNFVFTPEAVVVGHETARADMAERGLGLCAVWPHTDWGDIRLVLPTLTFEDRLTLRLGGLRAEVLHLGLAHTTSDTVVWVPEHGVLFAGDVVLSEVAPFCLMGSVAGTLRALDRLAALEGLRTVVCGHGPVCGPQVLDVTRRYLTRVQELARWGVAREFTPLETARKAGLGAYAGLVDGERLVANLHRAYAEEHGEPAGVRLPSAPIMREMADFKGSPLVCEA
ncbi:MBL fold metallo-hydrolase [Streptomyces sp. NPDC050759]|uniref:MBL fold metallo-hydrolase n=1 Tax=Streptomyces sp. NPDC050759 TaxID=3365635 RepID=UPI00379CE937